MEEEQKEIDECKQQQQQHEELKVSRKRIRNEQERGVKGLCERVMWEGVGRMTNRRNC